MKLESGKEKRAVLQRGYEDLPDQEVFLKIRDDLLHSLTGIRMDEQIARLDRERFLEEINLYIDRIYHLSEEKKQRFDAYILQYTFGYHVLTELMEADNITDIKVLAWNKVRIKEKGQRKETAVSFWSPEDLSGFTEMLAVRNGINIGNLNAIQTFTDQKSSEKFIYRYNISTKIVNSTGAPYLQIRKIPKQKLSLQKLITQKMLDEKMASYLVHRLGAGYLLICGKGGAGKTYLLNALLDHFPRDKAVLVVQENEELFSEVHPEMLFQHIAIGRGENRIHYGLKELVINGLLIDVDFIVIGEIKGGEALYFLNAALTGNQGVATLHSENALQALHKLADYCKWESDYSKAELMRMLTGCVRTIVHLDHFRVDEIIEPYGWEAETGLVRYRTVYDREKGVNTLT